MKKFNVPTAMDCVLQVVSKKYRIHLKREHGTLYIAKWVLNNGSKVTLYYHAHSGTMKAYGIPPVYSRFRAMYLEGFNDCLRMAKRQTA